MATQNMSMWGIGPKMALITFPYFALTIILSYLYPNIFNLDFIPWNLTTILGTILLILGIIFYISSARTLLKEFQNGKLLTKGPYSLCRNPLYSAFIVFIIPAISLLINSWLALTTAVLMYFVFKCVIKAEYNYLKEKFGDEYIQYEKNVNEIIPIPKF
ncbi:MAG: isoprenylcysteine carboxylmethyltransferase family protein [Ignavibacteriae bacterium]|nr:MAG: isoprenylcysteine carboxylmethyltransferase family protein [Ignavibacteriota bacterium]